MQRVRTGGSLHTHTRRSFWFTGHRGDGILYPFTEAHPETLCGKPANKPKGSGLRNDHRNGLLGRALHRPSHLWSRATTGPHGAWQWAGGSPLGRGAAACLPAFPSQTPIASLSVQGHFPQWPPGWYSSCDHLQLVNNFTKVLIWLFKNVINCLHTNSEKSKAESGWRERSVHGGACRKDSPTPSLRLPCAPWRWPRTERRMGWRALHPVHEGGTCAPLGTLCTVAGWTEVHGP